MSLNITSIENEGDACFDMAAAMPGLQTVTGENLFIITVIDGAANFYGHITFHLKDTASGRPVTDLQTYLGAFGHTLIMSEDMVDYVHSRSHK